MRPVKAIVLCAGRGTRLGSLTAARPKALLPIAGRPLIAHTLNWLSRQGVTEVLINLHHFPAAIPESVGGGDAFGIAVTYVYEARLLGTAGTVRAAREWIGEEDVLVIYGDLLLGQNLTEMWLQHRLLCSDATLLLHRRKESNSVVVMDEDRRITAFAERPARPGWSADAVPSWVNSGVQILSPALVRRIPQRVPADLPADVYEPLVTTATIHGVPLSGPRVAIDSPARLVDAELAMQASAWVLDRE